MKLPKRRGRRNARSRGSARGLHCPALDWLRRKSEKPSLPPCFFSTCHLSFAWSLLHPQLTCPFPGNRGQILALLPRPCAPLTLIVFAPVPPTPIILKICKCILHTIKCILLKQVRCSDFTATRLCCQIPEHPHQLVKKSCSHHQSLPPPPAPEVTDPLYFSINLLFRHSSRTRNHIIQDC